MRLSRPTFFSMSSALASMLLSMGLTAPLMPPLHHGRGAQGKPTKRRKTGWIYPHSSSRQQARYARQIARGQLSMAADKD